ncbi:MAG: carboxypeptidase regulatory-like domain-containing protein, partial [Acidobacteria bacterium]
MNRLFTLFGTTVVAGLVVWTPPAAAQSESYLGGENSARRMARAASGLIQGTVVDDVGRPLPGVMISALGSTSSLAVTDRQGAFSLKDLPAGAYLVRAHMSGFAPSPREFVQVRPGRPARFSATL